MKVRRRLVTLLLLIIYVISPVDIMAGPVDDVVLSILYAVANLFAVSNNKS